MERTRSGNDLLGDAGPPSETGADWSLTGAAFIDEFEEQEGLYRVEYDAGQATPSLTIITVISIITGKDPFALDPMYESIDSEAVDALFAAECSSVSQLTFQYSGCEITVKPGGVIEVMPG